MTPIDITTDICGTRLQNPIIAASGTFGYGEDMLDFFSPALLGGIATKGISLLPREGNETPRIAETPCGMLNAIGLNNVGLARFLEEKLPFLNTLTETATIVNFYGNRIEDYAELSEKLSLAQGVDLLEMNVSCPNVKEGGIAFGTDEAMLNEVVSACREKATKPLIVKLSPNVTNIAKMAEVAVSSGADAISLINTLTGLAVDIERRKPILANVIGGVSGPCIKPVALRMVWEVANAVEVPVIGMGGITTVTDALEFLMVGASAVQIGTASFIHPNRMAEIVHSLPEALQKLGVSNLSEWIGSLQV